MKTTPNGLKSRTIRLLAAAASIALMPDAVNAGDGLDRHAVDALMRVARTGIAVGAYDPHGMLANTKGLTVEHIYLPWRDVDLKSLADAGKYARDRGRSLVVTVEPWTWSFRRKTEASDLHKTILSGQSDPWIAAVCKSIGALHGPVTVRFGHEMDLKNDRYPWSNWSPAEFIAAYRHFVDECRKVAPAAKFMWSPHGEANSKDYYPGHDYVDAVGLSVFAFQKYDEGEFGRWRTPSDLLSVAYNDLSPFEKDIWAVEFGCDGEEDYRISCYDDLLKLQTKYPTIKGVLLFNEVEPHAWPKGYGRPDWRIGPARVN